MVQDFKINLIINHNSLELILFQTLIAVADCATYPCQNGGTCTNALFGYTCTCMPGFSGPDCARGDIFCKMYKS